MTWKQVSGPTARCCRTLWQAGFEAYPVGGCVRDMLLGRVPGDWDVTTSALPEQVTALFDHVVQTGVKHGTVTVILEDEHIEVTTFRGESGYSDGRHPDMVRFDATLEQDLARRDFTINAMALAPDGTVIDLFGGLADLKGKVIRCVGRPEQRFGEDGLRMFRAVRFAAQLDFDLEWETKRAIQICAPHARNIAAERVRVELEKTLCACRADMAWSFFDLGLMKRWTVGVPNPPLGLERLPGEPLLRWAGLCAGLFRDGCIEDAAAFLAGLRLDRRTLHACGAGEELWRSGLPNHDTDWRRALVRYGTDGCRAAAAMGGADALLQVEAVLAQEPCVRVEQLALSGQELAQMGLRGVEIGAAQRALLEHVLAHPEDNRVEILRRKVKGFSDRQ